ncbi:MAG TPA: hypothetical protein DDY98_07915 [Ruminococcaceae bacterium]|nr:hypothetical protein [Oscillospiraceae bacterium]
MKEFFIKLIASVTALTTLVSSGIDTVQKYHFVDLLAEGFATYFKADTSDEVDKFLAKTGGVVKGVCHPNSDTKQISEANIQWVRFDLNELPYDGQGKTNASYQYAKSRAKYYADAGFKVMLITPYPKDYIAAGIDPRTEDGKKKVKEIAEFYAKDLQGIASAFQITNEMGVDHFTVPLTIQQAAEFIGIQMEAMNNVKKDIVVGFNIAAWEMYNLCYYVKPWLDYADYVGVDIYLGCFENVFKTLYGYDFLTRFVWGMTKKPVMVCEFGYIGYGEAKSTKEKNEILQSYGYENEAAARADIRGFINNLPTDFRDHMLNLGCTTDEELAAKLFDTELINHLYCELPEGYTLRNFKHNPEDQAKFFTKTIAKLQKHKFVVGGFVYCYEDSNACYICGQSDCPVETGWGLVDLKGNPKPAYYAVRDAFANWK